MIPELARQWILDQWGQEVVSEQPVSGGCINHGKRLRLANGKTCFLKQNDSAPADMFDAEYAGLLLLGAGDGPRVPEPFHFGDDFLLTEDLAPAKSRPDWEAELGRQLAQMHQRSAETFGLDRDNYIGSTPQINSQMEDGYEFFAVQRLSYQARLARDRQLLSRSEVEQIEALGQKLPDLIPQQRPALLHGDLWSGNAIADKEGNPALIDPATYYGWPEAELAMTMLFGGFGTDFYSAYQANSNLEAGWADRLPLYNLYHLLNHLNLFGPSYHSQTMAIVRRFS